MGKRIKLWLWLGIIGLVFLTAPQKVFAFNLDVTNNQEHTMSFAILYYDDDVNKWVCRGWYNVPTATTKTYQFSNSSKVKHAFLYATAGDLHWDGEGGTDSITRWVIGDKFKYYDGQVCPQGSKRRKVSFFKFGLCTNGASLIWGEPANTENQPTDMTQDELTGIELLNSDRAKNGLPPLTADPKLAQVARNHACDMVAQHYFNHTNLKGQSPFDRLDANGISYTAAGENIAYNETITKMEDAWMHSPGHRANILNSQFTHVGLGLCLGSDGSLYGVQLFARY